MAEAESEQCQNPGCGILWPVGALTPLEAKLANGRKKTLRVCPKCLSELVDKAGMISKRVCGMCANFFPGEASLEGDPMGGCGIYKRMMLASDPECEHFKPMVGLGD